MDIIFTLSDFGAAANVGDCGVDKESFIVTIHDDLIPIAVKRYIDSRKRAEEGPNKNIWSCLSISYSEPRIYTP